MIRKVNTNLTLSPMTNEPMIIMTGGSSCPGNPEQTASTAIRVRSDYYVLVDHKTDTSLSYLVYM